MYSPEFQEAIEHAMHYEVGGFWKLTPEVRAGLIADKYQRRAVGYVNDPADTGGETKYGIAQNANPDIVVRDLTWEGAQEVYYTKYWLAGRCHLLPARLAVLHFDGCVNHGVTNASKFLQRALGVEDDGRIGPATLGAVNLSDERVICQKICDLREDFYRTIVRNRPTQARFLNGWLSRIHDVEDLVLNRMTRD